MSSTQVPAHTCWFCVHDNPSYATVCEGCGNIAIPTKFDTNPVQTLITTFRPGGGEGYLPARDVVEMFNDLSKHDRAALRFVDGTGNSALIISKIGSKTRFSFSGRPRGDNNRVYKWNNGVTKQVFCDVVDQIMNMDTLYPGWRHEI
ncbi:hypothetical protein A1O3_06142 [Capronia epimyces CBS 606.96]|uniref:RanBP2-type domain-containing protein n=1 Tax=Capronia epimyces CBS 606.96 TaxID=1182542 RepID=W9YJ93_9EURO|nr:uncharacterized protein A1O3_06142 [Capronia epimyces CBS 606.96]EXJ82329.1 hypothetical protein A1O3_06142 [Capronia epimyces CBS 606.96]